MSHLYQNNSGVPARRSASANRQTDVRRQPTQTRVPAVSQVSRAVAPPEDDDALYTTMTQVPRSAYRYTNEDGNDVIRSGNRQLIVHHKERRRAHWLLFVGLGALAAILLWAGAQELITTIQANSLNATYGYPRTYQMDQVVGHEDSASNPSHFTFENLHGHVIVIEIPGGDDFAHARIYAVLKIYTPNGDQVPVTGSFADVNGDGKLDMLITVGTGTTNTQTITFLNNGTIFVPQS